MKQFIIFIALLLLICFPKATQATNRYPNIDMYKTGEVTEQPPSQSQHIAANPVNLRKHQIVLESNHNLNTKDKPERGKFEKENFEKGIFSDENDSPMFREIPDEDGIFGKLQKNDKHEKD